MKYTEREFGEICRAVCRHCAVGNVPRFRPDTAEYVHDLGTKSADGKFEFVKQTICFATNFRQSNLSGGME